MRYALLLLALFALPSCASTQPPPGTYTPQVQAKYNATPLQQGILALSESAVAANKATGAAHLSVQDTKYVRDFALSASTAVDSYVNGTGTLGVVVQAFNSLLKQLSQDAQSSSLKLTLATLQTLVDSIPVGVQ